MKNIITLIQNNIDVFLSAIAAIIFPSIGFVIALFILIVADMVTGIWKAVKTKQKITSRKMSVTASKTMLYFIMVIVGWVSAYLFGYADLVKLFISMLGIIEIRSISENFTAITGIKIWAYLVNIFKRKSEDLGAILDTVNKDDADVSKSE